jgi:hypothetical protein
MLPDTRFEVELSIFGLALDDRGWWHKISQVAKSSPGGLLAKRIE